MSSQWKTAKLADLCEFRNGLWKGKKPPFIHVGVIRNTNFRADGSLDYSNIAYLDVEEKQFSKRQLQYGDIILEKSGGGPKQPVGRVVVFDKQEGLYSFSNFTSVIRILDPSIVDFSFLHRLLYWYYWSGITEDMQRRSTGIRNLDFNAYKELPVFLPPLSDQKRIVAILDEALAGIATAVANTEKNLANARELFESYLNSVFSQQDNGWVEVRLGDICERVSVGHVGSTTEFYCEAENGIPFLRSQNVRRGNIDWRNVRYITKEFNNRLRKSQLRQGDLLFVRVGANRGDCSLVRENVDHLNCANIVFARPRNCNLEFLELYANSLPGRKQLLGMTTGSAQGVINTKSVAELIIPYPPANIQATISGQSGELAEEVYRLESISKQKLTALAELKQSLLQKAFSGELIAQTKPIKEEVAA